MKNIIANIVALSLVTSCGDGSSAVNAVAAVTDTAPKCEPASQQEPTATKAPADVSSAAPSSEEVKPSKAAKLTMEGCTDPDLSKLAKGEPVTLCNGETAYGTFVPETSPTFENCSRNGQTGCLANGKFAANDVTDLSSGNLKKGVIVAGVTGTYEEPTYQACNGNGQTGCLSSTSFPANNVSGLAPSNLRSGVTVAGVSGSYDPVVESHTDCTARGQTGCIATAAFPTIDAASSALLVSGNIKSGVTIAGVTGSYPSATTPLAGASSVADLDNATFPAKVKSSTSFEYFDSTGARHENQGSDYIQEQYVRSGITIFGVAGTYGYTGINAFDIRQDVIINGVTGTLKADCRGYENSIPAGKECNRTGFEIYAVDDCSGSNCYIHRSTNKVWKRTGSGSPSTTTYATAKQACSLLTELGGGWRMPSIPEIQVALHKIMFPTSLSTLNIAVGDTGYWANYYNTAVIVNTQGSIANAAPTPATTGATTLCVKDL